MKKISLLLCAAFACSSALALDVSDVGEMLRNKVSENVILDMIGNRGVSAYPTADEIIEMHKAGASPELLEALTAASPAEETADSSSGASEQPPASDSLPDLEPGEGWLSVDNRSGQDYVLTWNLAEHDLFLTRGREGGDSSAVVPSGTTIVVVLPREDYDLEGEIGDDLEFDIYEGMNTMVVLEDFGAAGAVPGLMVTADDGYKLRSAILFDS